MARVLIIEDDQDIRNILSQELAKEGYDIEEASSGTQGRLLLNTAPDIILMDLMLPGLTGEELLPLIPKDIPVIAVSAKAAIENKIELLSGGCVDYITKPFDIRELKVRVAAHLRTSKQKAANEEILTASDISLDVTKHVVKINDQPVHLTRTEYAILKILMTDAGNVISKTELLSRAVEDTPDLVESSLKVHMSNLRKKLKDVGGKDYIEAVWGIGFKIAQDA